MTRFEEKEGCRKGNREGLRAATGRGAACPLEGAAAGSHGRAPLGILFLLLLMALPGAWLGGCDLPWKGEKKEVIRLHDDQIDMLKINNAIVEYIIEHGYGYPVERVERTTKEISKLLASGDIDLSLEMWLGNNLDWFRSEEKKGRIVSLGALYRGQQFWMIPRWVAEQYAIRNVADMRRHWQLFQDPDDPSKGVFFNCIMGWTCLEINDRKLRAYGLDKYYNAVSPSSPEALVKIFENAQLKKMPVFGYYWIPNALMASYDWQILEEPPFEEECWNDLITAPTDAIDPTCGCAYGADAVHKLANAQLADKAPEVVAMLEKMQVEIRILNEVLAWGRSHEGLDWERAAMYFLRTFEEVWRSWVPPENFERIKSALAQSDGD